MKDRDFLIWLHNRFEYAYGEDPIFDYMHKFRAIISDYPKNKTTPNDGRGKNSLEDLLKELKYGK